MSAVTNLAVEERKGTGKGAARELRRQGKVPGIIYGGKEKEVNIAVEQRHLVRELNRGSFTSRLFEIEINGTKLRALPRDVQLHPVTDLPEHVDFMRISKDAKVNVYVHVTFLNNDKAPGLKRGGVLNVVRHEVELVCSPDSIPTQIVVDLAGLEIGASVHASHVKLPEGAAYAIKDRDFTIATIAGRAKEEEEIPTTAPVAAGEVPTTAQKTPEELAAAAGGAAPAAGAKAAAPAAGKDSKEKK